MQAAARRIVITLMLACLPALVLAQPFPNGPINIVVPLAPGDAADISVRLLGEEIAKTLNTTVVVTNRPDFRHVYKADYDIIHAEIKDDTFVFVLRAIKPSRVLLTSPAQ